MITSNEDRHKKRSKLYNFGISTFSQMKFAVIDFLLEYDGKGEAICR